MSDLRKLVAYHRVKLGEAEYRRQVLTAARQSLGRETLFLGADGLTITDPSTGEQWTVSIRTATDGPPRDLRALFVKPTDFRRYRGGNDAPRLNTVAHDGGGGLSAEGEAARQFVHEHLSRPPETLDQWVTRELIHDKRGSRR